METVEMEVQGVEEMSREELSLHQTYRNIVDKMVRDLDKFGEEDRMCLYASIAEHCSKRVKKYLMKQ